MWCKGGLEQSGHLAQRDATIARRPFRVERHQVYARPDVRHGRAASGRRRGDALTSAHSRVGCGRVWRQPSRVGPARWIGAHVIGLRRLDLVGGIGRAAVHQTECTDGAADVPRAVSVGVGDRDEAAARARTTLREAPAQSVGLGEACRDRPSAE